MIDVHFAGNIIDKVYFPILVPVGVSGNFLSLLVSTYKLK